MNARKTGLAVVALLTGLAFGTASAKCRPHGRQKAKAAETKVKADEAGRRKPSSGQVPGRAAENFKRGKGIVKNGAAPAGI